MALPTSFYALTISDNTLKDNKTPEQTVTQVPITTMTPANAAAVLTAIGNLKTAIAGITLGQFAQDQVVYQREVISAEAASDKAAQRETKVLCRYHDAVTGQKASVSIGTFDTDTLVDHANYVDLTAGVGLAFKTAFEALVVSPYNAANAVVLDSATHVGRNT